MTTFNVSGASQLANAINSARGGDVIRCAAGNYGTLNLSKKFSGNVTITSASDSNKATFNAVKANGAANVTFDSVKFDSRGAGELVRMDSVSNVTIRDSVFDGHLSGGMGTGYGLKVAKSSGVNIQNSDFFDFQFGLHFSRVTNINVSGNDLRSMKHDGMNFAQVVNGTIANNHFHDMKSQKGYTHKDMIQFWTSSAEGASKNVKITGNRMDSPDGETHGIYMGNPAARTGDRSKFFQDIVIENNFIRTSHAHGLSVEHVNGVTIRNNNLIHNKDWGHSKMVTIPLINVSKASTDVDIIGNTAPSIPKAANSTWTVAGNKETGSANLIHWNGIISGSAASSAMSAAEKDAGSVATALAADTDGAASAAADVFRFLGSKITTGIKTDTVDLDFGDGDTLVLGQYDNGSFRDVSGGNVVWNNAAGTYVVIDSVADLKELAAASSAIAVSANRGTGVVTVEIDQGPGTHRIQLQGLADEFFAL